MPGSTPVFGIPYPFLGESVDPTIFQQFADAVDAALNTQHPLVEAQLDRPWCELVDVSGQTVTQAVEHTVSFTELVDNDSMFTSGTNVTVNTPGIYMATGADFTLLSWTTLTSVRGAIYQNGVLRYAERKQETNSSISPALNLSGLLVCNAGDVITFRVLWTGTGGPATLSSVNADVRFICDIP